MPRKMPASVINTPTKVRSLRGSPIGTVTIAENRELSRWLEKSIDLSADISGVLPVAHGGTGLSFSVVWEPLANGDAVTPELIFAGGDVIMCRRPL